MADISKLNFNGVTYNIKDSTARSRVPAGGTLGQVLKKNSNTDYDVVWDTVGGGGGTGLPDGGSIGQVLVKNSNANGDASWYTPGHFPTDKWYLPTGVTESQVIAAWQFIGRNSEAEALLSINGNSEYSLLKNNTSILWNSDYGMYFPATHNLQMTSPDLAGNYNQIYSACFGYSGVSTTSGNYACGGIILDNKRILVLRGYQGGYINYPCINSSSSSAVAMKSSSITPSGVIGANWSSNSQMFLNGQEISLASTGKTFSHTTGYIGQFASSATNCVELYITAIAFYNTTLTSTQHLELNENIQSLSF